MTKSNNQMGRFGAVSYIIGNIVGSVQAETFAEYFLQCFNIKLCFSSKLLKTFLIKFIAYGLCWFLIFVNFFSLRSIASRFQIICSIAKILAILLIIGIGLYNYIFNKNIVQLNFSQPFTNTNFDISLIVNALFSALFSYDGWDILNFGAEEIKNLKQTMCFAMPIGIILVGFLYIFVNLAFLIVIPINEIIKDDSIPIATLFSNYSMGILKPLLPFLICILLIGSLNSTLFVASRYMLAAANKRQLPTFLSCINLKNDSPRIALLFQVILAFIFSFLNNPNKLISYLSFVMWTQHFNTSSIGIYILGFSLILFYLLIWESSPLLKSSKFTKIFNNLNEKLFIFTQIIFNGNQINLEETKN
ncbi:hypothetical protein Mgra_00000131 [Meloidogyne graminicola]|uniref:Uncharacterized protein n=1 Tax=Meloidogyne graminicola TaxID=189291 RepID=A0A8T0A4S2_9BILA|nr:hypothetical protein Mgra_00000131 [Meloidogyne graminicola]